MKSHDELRGLGPAELREVIRRGEYAGPTAGLAAGYAQANVVILPGALADDFRAFCEANPKPCPLIDATTPGLPEPPAAAPAADLRTDVPRYRVFRDGKADEQQPTDIMALWREDFVGFLLGCSFTFEKALAEAGLVPRHVEEGRNVPMYRTSIPCETAGPFAGPLVVSMRPYPENEVERAAEITSRYPRMHGGPIHVGDPAAIGIAELSRPDFGDAVTVREGELPVFWACGVTPQLALEAAAPDIAITHSPGCMFVTDLPDEDFLAP